MIWLIEFVHVIVCLMLIVIVLLQKGKGQDFASTFGGGGTQTSFGSRSGATILHRATTVAAVVFMLTSISLTILLSRPGQGSVLDDAGAAAQPVQQAPAQEPLPLTPPADTAPAPEGPGTIEIGGAAGEEGGAAVPEETPPAEDN